MNPTAPVGASPDILKAAVPRPEILASDLGDAMFAADFAEVVSGRASVTYTDPVQFFNNTHPTEPLQKIVRTVFRPLIDDTVLGGTIRLSTGFGGGKSHTLITLWHLARAGTADIGTELLLPSERPASVTVVAIDASKAGVPEFTRHGDRAVGSFWGEVFWQLAGDRGLAVLGGFCQVNRVAGRRSAGVA